MFEPIAIIGRGAVLPGVSSPDTLWTAVEAGRDLLTEVPEGAWPVPPREVPRRNEIVESLENRAPFRGGFILDSDVPFDPDAHRLTPAQAGVLDRSTRWLLTAGRDAFLEAGSPDAAPERTAVIVGNLSYPTHAATEAAYLAALGGGDDPLFKHLAAERFSSGRPAHLLAGSLGAAGPAFSLDAACASSLYAAKFACDLLRDDAIDIAYAGGVNGLYNILLHWAFSQINALSPTGRSRPFHRDADGLVPSEGAAVIALKRMADAVRDGDRIFAVIRAIGVSNDGRDKGVLAPSRKGQIAALEKAYQMSGIDPETIGYVECHATGTVTGDATELETLKAVYAGCPRLPIGSIKSNIGHLITTAGMAGILKTAASFRSGIKPATLHADQLCEAATGSNLHVLRESEPWPEDGIKRAGINNFGFGGNNAHMILEEYTPLSPDAAAWIPSVSSHKAAHPEPIVICGLEWAAGDRHQGDVYNLSPGEENAMRISLPITGSAFPPTELANCLGQQSLPLHLARQLVGKVKRPDASRIALAVGMGMDLEGDRACLVWRSKGGRLNGELDRGVSDDDLMKAWQPLEKMHACLGAMPNLVANRINIQLDACGYGLTVSAEELSGITAIDIGCRALRNHETDLFLAGAVDLSQEQLHKSLCAVIPELSKRSHLDGACLFALKRRSDAIRDGDPVYAEVSVGCPQETDGGQQDGQTFSDRYGHAHAASGILDIADAIMRFRSGNDDRPAALPLGPPAPEPVSSMARSFTGRHESIRLQLYPGAVQPPDEEARPALWYGGEEHLAALADQLGANVPRRDGRYRLAIVARSSEELDKRKQLVRRQLEDGKTPAGPGVCCADRRAEGDVAFVYPGMGVATPNLADGWAQLFPDILAPISKSMPKRQWDRLNDAISRCMEDPSASEQAIATAAGSFINTRIAIDILGVQPDACLAVSQGEANMLASMGVWSTPMDVLEGHEADGFYENAGSRRQAIAYYLGLAAGQVPDWQAYDVLGPVDRVQEIANQSENVWVMIIYSPEHCFIGGLPEPCAEVLRNLGKDVRVIPRPNATAFHGPFAETMRDKFLKRHLVDVNPRDELRFYFNATNTHVANLTSEKCAQLYCDQGFKTVDFPKTVRAAWEDGVRTFIDVGPKSVLTTAVSKTLAGRDHIALGLDTGGQSAANRLAKAAAQLFVYGLCDNMEGVTARLSARDVLADSLDQRQFEVPAHRPALHLEELKAKTTRVPLANEQLLARVSKPETHDNLAVLPDKNLGDIIELDIAMKNDARRMRPAPALPRQAPFSMQVLRDAADQQPRVMRAPGVSGSEAAELETVPLAAVAGGTSVRVPAYASGVAQGAAGVRGTGLKSITPNSGTGHEQENTGKRASAVSAGKPSVFAASAKTLVPIVPVEPSGLTLDRQQLEHVAGDRISDVFGELFVQQDGYRRQCRMPQPPMLLADRVTGISGEAGSLGKGICWTETDVREDAWYLDGRYMPTGILIEAGQADLLLISWLGCDFENRSERVYRLLGCEITFHDRPLPKIGDTIKYQIHIDAHATYGKTRMFFFRYDAKIAGEHLISVRSGQAGFFTDEELANSDGVLWEAGDEQISPDTRFELPETASGKRRFSAEDVRSFADGDAYTCFGAGFEFAAAHQHPPGIPSGRMQMFDEVEVFEPRGGPWGRGYLKAVSMVEPDAWFYEGHFLNDPCMPGTLMAEAAAQALQFHMAALGLTIHLDGFRFRPVANVPFKFVCRGQVIPDRPHRITYEVFVEEIGFDDGIPVVFAALLARSDGFKVFLCRRFGMTLGRDWPLHNRDLFKTLTERPTIISPSGDVRGDHTALIEAAWGRPSKAFGPLALERDPELDRLANPPRLPGPPYHFMSRVLSVDCDPCVETPGGFLRSEYDVAPDDWYFEDGATGTMPFSVLCEVLLQPCGWFASYMGYALGKTVKFRNLDGDDVVLLAHVTPHTGTLSLDVRFVKASRVGPMTLVFYEVTCRAGGQTIMTLKTDFGFFPAEALAQQKGLPAPQARKDVIAEHAKADPDAPGTALLHDHKMPRLPKGRLTLVDDVTGYEAHGGAAGLGRLVGRQTIEPGAWYFKAHFFTDPVQPGSLGLEALFNLFKALVRKKGLDQAFRNPVFEAPATDNAFEWHYRGQVVPTNALVVTEFELTGIAKEADALLVKGAGSLWVDGLRIYEVKNYALRLRDANADQTARLDTVSEAKESGKSDPLPLQHALDRLTISLETEPWLAGHKPSYTVPVYPLMGMVGKLLAPDGICGGGEPVRSIENLEVRGWLRLDKGPLELAVKSRVSEEREILTFHRVSNGETDRRIAVQAQVLRGQFGLAPEKWPEIRDGDLLADPYGMGELFHDGAFETAFDIRRTAEASSFTFDIGAAIARAGGDPSIMLDALLKGFPHFAPFKWFGPKVRSYIAFPYRLERFEIYGEIPKSGMGEVTTRKLDMPSQNLIRFEAQFSVGGRVITFCTVSEVLVPSEAFDRVPFSRIRGFCLSGHPEKAFHLSRHDGEVTRLSAREFRRANWLPGTFERIYAVPDADPADPMPAIRLIAIKDHLRRRYDVNPGVISVEGSLIRVGHHAPVSLAKLKVEAGEGDEEVVVSWL
ncbi:type I polyketide synthase [Roseibium sp. RKSG952]|uniref:type I polyketide synthase n=1 Tax=Roseibium sp. RKSG952 TaxID=2529384 RepID=UPI0012BC1468|nr:type I polyketide synthase [Roseibium sp. RKSG952]MTH99048.1 acyltransferase domain-containing protein [Roseibium sp. RKSG952]